MSEPKGRKGQKYTFPENSLQGLFKICYLVSVGVTVINDAKDNCFRSFCRLLNLTVTIKGLVNL